MARITTTALALGAALLLLSACSSEPEHTAGASLPAAKVQLGKALRQSRVVEEEAIGTVQPKQRSSRNPLLLYRISRWCLQNVQKHLPSVGGIGRMWWPNRSWWW